MRDADTVPTASASTASAGAPSATLQAQAPTGQAGDQLAALAQSAPDIDNPDAVEDTLVSDPYEDWNRYVFDLNTLIYMFLQPVIAPYGVLPEERQDNVDNFLHNVSTPVILLNDLLQGEVDRAWVTTQRFGVNSTVGLLGFVDAAEEMGLPKHSEDFGQTLGVWGLGDSPYMVYPLLGPGNPRDGVGRMVDMVSDPMFWLTGNTGQNMARMKTYATVSSQLGSNTNRLEELRSTSIDFYAAVRSLYVQSRRAAIANDEGNPAASAPAISRVRTGDTVPEPAGSDAVGG
ncbi:MlaA family lipoprotein [Roseospira navarrensis]|nr:VacJ family lipoprotein [Roseospira navarrensis]